MQFWHIIMERTAYRYNYPRIGKLFTMREFQEIHHDRWIVRSFDTREEAIAALETIDEWYTIDLIKRGWLSVCNLYNDTGTGKICDVFNGDDHVRYMAFVGIGQDL